MADGRTSKALAVVAAAAAVLATIGAATAQQAEAPRPARLPFAPPDKNARAAPPVARVLVRLKEGASATAASVVGSRGGSVGRPSRVPGFVAAFPPAGVDARDFAAQLRRDPAVAEAQVDYRRRIAATPSDPHYEPYQRDYLSTVRLPEAWDRAKGAGVTIAVVDSGVDLDHPDLAPRLAGGYDFVRDDATPDDESGHGTMVAGIAAATSDNGIGVAGVAPAARIMPLKVLDADGAGWDSDVAAAIRWAADNGADVINLSLGGPFPSSALESALAHAATKGVVVVASSGNDAGPGESYPAAYDTVISVSATGHSGDGAWFSTSGMVDIAAPGVEITSTAVGAAEAYATASGTSFAAPIVSGVAALVLSAHPTWSYSEVALQLEATARDAGEPGWDEHFGAGIVDAFAALGGGQQPAVPVDGGADDPNGALADGTSLGTAGTARLGFEGDVDWFRRTVSQPTWMALSVSAPPLAGPRLRAQELDPILTVHHPDKSLLAYVDERFAGESERVILPFTESGTYYAKVENYASSASPAYTVRAEPIVVPAYDVATLPTASSAVSVATGDVTGDGRADVLATTSMFNGHSDPTHDHRVLLWRQQPDGTLLTAERFVTRAEGGGAMTIATGDLGGAPTIDVAVAHGNGVEIFESSGDTLVNRGLVPGSRGASALQVGDVTGDGRADLVVGRTPTPGGTDYEVAVYERTGDFTFTPVVLGRDRVAIDLGDLTGDGRLDVTATAGAEIWLYTRGADGSYARTTWAALERPWLARNLEIADVTGDARADLIATAEAPVPHAPPRVALMVLRGGGAAPGAPDVFPLAGASAHGALTAADFNGDLRRDVHVSGVGLLLQLTSGDFALSKALLRTASAAVATGDVDTDGDTDLVAAGRADGVFVNRRGTDLAPYDQRFNIKNEERAWVERTAPVVPGALPQGASPSVTFSVPMNAATLTHDTVRLFHGATGELIPATVSYDAGTRTVRAHPKSPLAAGNPYSLEIDYAPEDGLPLDLENAELRPPVIVRFTVSGGDSTPPETTITTAPAPATQSGYTFFRFRSEAGATFECALDGADAVPCVSPWYYRPWAAAGDHRLVVRAVDAAGNTETTPVTYTWNVGSADTTPPETTIVSGPRAFTKLKKARFVFESNEAAVGFQCALDGAAWATCTSGDVHFIDWVPGGSHTLAVRARDHAGNLDPSPATYTWTVDGDHTAPVVTIDAGPIGLVSATRATFAFSANEPNTVFRCALDTADLTPCVSPITYDGITPGSHNVRVIGVDAAGNIGSTSRDWIVDHPPHKNENLVKNGTFEAGTSGWSGWRAGVTAVSPGWESGYAARVAQTTGDSYSLNPAVRQITQTVAGRTYEARAAVRSDVEGRSVCLVIRERNSAGAVIGSVSNCVRAMTWWQPFPFIGRGYTTKESGGSLELYAYQSGAVAGDSFVIDNISLVDMFAPPPTGDVRAPETTIESGPSGTVAATSATFTFYADEQVSKYECKLDAAAWTTTGCISSGTTYSGLAAGEHTFMVRATDFAGNTDPSPAMRTWTVQASPTPPPPPPPPPAENVLPNGGFESGLAGWDPWRATLSLVAGKDGLNAARVTHATGTSYSIGATPRPVSATVNGQAWVARAWIKSPAGKTVCLRLREYDAAGTFVAAAQACLAGVGAWQETAAIAYTARGGSLDLYAYQSTTAAAGDAFEIDGVVLRRADAPPAGDTDPPETTITSGPTGTVSATSASFEFSSSEAGSRFDCRLDDGAWAACTSPKEYTSLAASQHTFAVRAIDAAGNVDATPATRTWTLQGTPPPPAAENVLPNGGFESGLGGWGPWRATLSLVAGKDGVNAARVAHATGTSYSIGATPRPVSATVNGQSWVARAWIKSPAGKTVCLRLREYDAAGTFVAAAQACLAGTGAWQETAAIAYTARGGSLDLYAYQSTTAAAGDAFEIDGVVLRRAAA